MVWRTYLLLKKKKKKKLGECSFECIFYLPLTLRYTSIVLLDGK